MALAAAVSGAGILVSSGSVSKVFRVAAMNNLVVFTETKTTTVREWVALTMAAAIAWRDGEKATGESREIAEDNRIIGSYKATSTTETTTLTKTFQDY